MRNCQQFQPKTNEKKKTPVGTAGIKRCSPISAPPDKISHGHLKDAHGYSYLSTYQLPNLTLAGTFSSSSLVFPILQGFS